MGNRVEIAKLGGIVAVLQAMTLHPAKADVQGAGCMALGELASESPRNAKIIAENGGIQALEQAISNHPKLQSNGFAVIEACREYSSIRPLGKFRMLRYLLL